MSGGVVPSWSPPMHKHRHLERARRFRQVGVAHRGAGADIAIDGRAREHGAVADKIGIVGSPVGGREPALHHDVGNRRDAVRIDCRNTLVPARLGAYFVRGVAEHQSGDALGMQRRQPLRDQAADGEPDDDSLFDPEMVEQRSQVADMVGQCIGRRRRLGKPVAALVVAHEAEAAAEFFDDRIPDAEIRTERIGENQRRQFFAPLTS